MLTELSYIVTENHFDVQSGFNEKMPTKLLDKETEINLHKDCLGKPLS